MLKELAGNIPVKINFTMADFDNVLTRDFILLIHEEWKIDLTAAADSLTSAEIEKVVGTIRRVYKKISANTHLSEDEKIFVLNLLLSKLLELWQMSQVPELFFAKIRQNFSPAEIVAAFVVYINNLEKFDWIVNFFFAHRNIFPTKQKKIRTIGIYNSRFYNGGIERFLSLIIPIYLQLGYRIIFFTDEHKPEIEYKLNPPPPPENFKQIFCQSENGNRAE